MMDYEYIYRVYGSSFYPGDTVKLFGDGREAVVLPPRPSQLHYVHVEFSDGTTGVCDLRSVKIHARGAAWDADQKWTDDT